MATSNNRDVRLGIEIETAGEESVKRLAAAVRSLGQEGDPAALEYQRLANELDRLGEQAGAIQALQTLRTDVLALSAAEQTATAAAKASAAAYGEQAAAANDLRDAQTKARTDVAQAVDAYNRLNAEYKTLKNSGAEAGQSQTAFNAALREARQQVIDQNLALQQRRQELTQSNLLVREATKAENDLARESNASAKAATGTVSALQAQAAALAQVEAAALGLGVETEDLNAAQAALLATTQDYISKVGQQRALVSREQADADHLAAVETRALAEARREAVEQAASELAAIRESEQFTKQYTAAKAAAAAETLKLALAEEKRVAILIEQNAADRAAFDAAQGLAAARNLSRVAAESELAAIRDSEVFIKQYAAAQREAAEAALAVAAADERASIAAKSFAEAEAAAAAQFTKLADQAAVANLFAQELQRIDNEAEAAAASTKRLAEAGALVSQAFGNTGVRSLQAIRAEMTGVAQSLVVLKGQFANGAIGADDLARAASSAQVRLATLRQELQTIPTLPNVFEKINSSINDLIGRFGSLTAAIATVGFAVKPVLDAATAFESLRRTLTVTTGSAEIAAQQIEFLRTTANAAGLSAKQLAQSFSLFEASLLKSGIPLKDTQALFAGVASAAGTLGLSTDRVNGILLALGQVANKGKVSLEELQGQIGEALPGALKLSADSLGITTAQLSAMLKEGKLLAEDFLPAFAKQLNTTFTNGAKPVEGLAQAFNRVKNAATETAQKVVDTSAYRALTSALDAVARNFDTVVASTVAVGKAFAVFKAIDIAREFLGIKAAAELAAASKLKDAEAAAVEAAAVVKTTVAIEAETLALNTNTAARARNTAASTFAGSALAATSTGFAKTAEAAGTATRGIGSLVGVLGGPFGAALALAVTFSEQLGNGLAYVAAKAEGSIGKLKAYEQQTRLQAQQDKFAAEAAAVRAEVVVQSNAKIQVVYDQQLVRDEAAIKISALLVKAKKDEGAASVTNAEIIGNETLVKDTAAKAATANAQAITNELTARRAELKTLEDNRAALIANAGAESTWSAARKQSFADSALIIERKKAEIEATREQAIAEQAVADKTTLAAQAYRDNSGALAVLKERVNEAFTSYEALTAAFKEGLTSQASLDAGARKLALAEGLYHDALDDTTAALERKAAKVKIDQSLTEATLNLEKARADAAVQIATLDGNDEAARQARIQSKQIEVKIIEAKIAATKLEVAAIIATAEANKIALDAEGKLTEQKRLEIDASIANAKVKALEADASGVLLEVLKKQIDNLIIYGEESVKARTGSAGAIQTETGALEKNTSTLDRNATSLKSNAAAVVAYGNALSSASASLDKFNARNTSTPNDASNQIGNGINGGFGTLANSDGKLNIPEGYTFDQAAYNRALAAYFKTVGTSAPHTAAPNAQDYVVASPTIGGAKPKVAGNGTNAGTSLYGAAPASAPIANDTSSTHTVNVTINGKPAVVNTASAADSKALVSMLTSLESAARSSGTQLST